MCKTRLPLALMITEPNPGIPLIFGTAVTTARSISHDLVCATPTTSEWTEEKCWMAIRYWERAAKKAGLPVRRRQRVHGI